MIKKDVYSHIAENNIRIIILLLLFPVSFTVFAGGIFLLVGYFLKPDEFQVFTRDFGMIISLAGILCFILTILSFVFGDKMMLFFAGAKLCPDDEANLKVYRKVENIAITAGLPMPKVYLIDDDSLNAFATGFSPKTASIALTTGIVKKLDDLELEAVIAHEMAHIKNRDIRLNMYIVTGIGVIGLVGEILLHSSRSTQSRKRDVKSDFVFFLIAFILLVFRFFIAPLIHLAISRKQEFQADATGVYFTRNPQALVSALLKISEDPKVESLENSQQMAVACIYNPLEKIGGLFDTHPPVAERIKKLDEMS